MAGDSRSGKFAFFLVPAILTCLIFSVAETGMPAPPNVVIIKLKNKGEIKGVVIQEDEDGIVVDAGYGTVGISKDQIERIERPAGGEREEVEKAWEREKDIIERAGRNRKKDLENYHRRIAEDRRIKKEIAERAEREGEHRIKFTDSSKIIVKAVLNGEVRTTLLVDTGADLMLIPLEIARQLFDERTEFSKKVETKLADGTIREGIHVVLESVEVGGAKAEKVRAIVMDVRGGTGLLGMSFLNRFHLKVDSRNNELILKKK